MNGDSSIAVRRRLGRGIEILRTQPFTVVACFILLGWTALALVSPIIAYDDWYYHLPFAARLWGIAPGTFQFDDHLQARWVGFPQLWEWLQGLMWALTGSLRFIIIPQLVLCFLYFVIVPRTLSLPWHWLVLGFFASPMLLIHFQSLYVDLVAGLCLALGFFLLVRQIHAEHGSVLISAGSVVFLGMAGNIKVQAWLSALLIVLVVVPMAVAQLGWQKRAFRIAVIAAVAALISSATAISNLYRTSNPVYPLKIQVAGLTIFSGPEDPMNGADPPDYAGRGGVHVLPTPVSFVLSVTELDWTLRGVPAWYSIDGRAGDRPAIGGPSRTGGWGWLFVLLNGFLLAMQVVGIRKEADPTQRSLVIGAVAIIVASSLLPRCHELRYWLFLPLILLPVNLRFLSRLDARSLVGWAMIAAMLFGGAQAVLTPGTQLLTERLPLQTDVALPRGMASALRQNGRFCSDYSLLFRYSTAVTGVPGKLSLRPEDCKGVIRLSS